MRPQFSDCIRAIRGAAGDRRRYVETKKDGEVTFLFVGNRQYEDVLSALYQLLPVPHEQFSADFNHGEITISYRTCAHCNQRRSDHVPAGGQCLFASTKYRERTDG